MIRLSDEREFMAGEQMQIGEVAQQTGLSLRTIRYYEEMGLAVPSARSVGGFRLYAAGDVARLQLIKRMKPLDFSLEDTKELLDLLDALESAEGGAREELLTQVQRFHDTARTRVDVLRAQLTVAEGFADQLGTVLGRRDRATTGSS